MMNKAGKKLALVLTAGALLLSTVSYADESVPETNFDESFNQTGEAEFEEDFGNGERKGPGPNGGHGGFGGMQGNGAGMGMMENDPEIQAVLDENAGKFEQFSFTDEETGITLDYSLYIPEGYDGAEEYPLVMFIPDSTGAGLGSLEIVENYYGAAVWAGDEDQAKHPSFVLVPAYTETVTDDNWNASNQLDATVNLIRYLTEEYSINENRLYTTGQSMGCMSSLYLNSKYPDLFAASMYVSGQWDISVLEVLKEQTFFYITAGGDVKASGGQDEVMGMFDGDQIAYSFETWNAQDDLDVQNENVESMIAEGNAANMIRFETGSVLNGGNGMEHMASFNYAYKLSAVRDWLFEQSK